jgi:hypothetical protein
MGHDFPSRDNTLKQVAPGKFAVHAEAYLYSLSLSLSLSVFRKFNERFSFIVASKSPSDREARGMPARSALLRAIRKFLARQRRERRGGRARAAGQGGGDATRNFVGLAIPRNRRRRSNKQLFPPAFTLVLAATLALARLTPSRASPTKRGRSSRSLSSTLDWTERLLFQAREQPDPPLPPPAAPPAPCHPCRRRAKCFPGRLAARRLAA